MTSLIKPLNKYVYQPIYRQVRKIKLSKQASLYISHIPGAFLETCVLWFADWKLGLGAFLASEAIIPKLVYENHNRRRRRFNEQIKSGLEYTISK